MNQHDAIIHLLDNRNRCGDDETNYAVCILLCLENVSVEARITGLTGTLEHDSHKYPCGGRAELYRKTFQQLKEMGEDPLVVLKGLEPK